MSLPSAPHQPSVSHAAESALAERYRATRQLTENLVAPLSEADAMIQSMADASPAKWHLAHTTWFFETFLLRDHLPGYRLYHDKWPFLFNSYYEAEGARIQRDRRGMLSRPTLPEIGVWRSYVDEAMDALFANPALTPLIELGIAHEQQHQELLLTDIKHALFQHPLGVAMWAPLGGSRHATNGGASNGRTVSADAGEWLTHTGGVARIGHDGPGFAFDNEGPVHRVLLEPFALSSKLVTNADWAQFMADGGYKTPSLWLSDAWGWVNKSGVAAPLYWRGDEHYTHEGWQERDPQAPVAHISYYEADAFASWAGVRLPTEMEWEAVASPQDAALGNQLDRPGPVLPRAGDNGLFGNCWQFTRSAYLPYPRYQIADGAVGEYNGKFMAGQWVLKGASCATPRGHSRSSYRNFFYPHQRWQFTGLRLAKYM